MDEASSKHEELLDQNELVQRARAAADTVVAEAEERSRRVREGADHYASDVLSELENRLAGALGAIRKGRDMLERQRQAPDRPAGRHGRQEQAGGLRLAEPPEETAALESV